MRCFVLLYVLLAFGGIWVIIGLIQQLRDLIKPPKADHKSANNCSNFWRTPSEQTESGQKSDEYLPAFDGPGCNLSSVIGAKHGIMIEHGEEFVADMCEDDTPMQGSPSICCLGILMPPPICSAPCKLHDIAHARDTVLVHDERFKSGHCHEGYSSMVFTKCLYGRMTHTPVCSGSSCNTSDVANSQPLMVKHGERYLSRYCDHQHSLVNDPVVCTAGKLFPKPICARWCYTSDIEGSTGLRTVPHGDTFKDSHCYKGLVAEGVSTCNNGQFSVQPRCIQPPTNEEPKLGALTKRHAVINEPSKALVLNDESLKIERYEVQLPLKTQYKDCDTSSILHARSRIVKHGKQFKSSHCATGHSLRHKEKIFCHNGSFNKYPFCFRYCFIDHLPNVNRKRLLLIHGEVFTSASCRQPKFQVRANVVCNNGSFSSTPVCILRD